MRTFNPFAALLGSRAPRRIVRKRSKRWTLPENAVYVGHGSAFANPFVDVLMTDGRLIVVERNDSMRFDPADGDARDYYRRLVLGTLEVTTAALEARGAEIRARLRELRGLDLACWCLRREPCHADVLLGLARDLKDSA